MAKKDYYSVLELTDDDKKLNTDEFKKVLKGKYRTLSKKYHPDVNPDNKEAEEKFKEISEAFEILSDVNKKRDYDNFGHSGSNRMSNGFGGFGGFGGFSSKPVRYGDTISLLVKLTLEEISIGLKKKYEYNRNAMCTTCSGNGGTNPYTCTTCNGSGVVLGIIDTPVGQFRAPHPCHSCDGNGDLYRDKCDTCSGSGIKVTQEKIDVNIPAGVIDGMTFVMRGKGNHIKGGESGDLHIKIMELPHKQFIRNGSDLKMNLKLDYTQLVLGDKVDINTIDGKKIRITIPEFSDVGMNLKIQGKGLKSFDSDNIGDLIIVTGIDIPKKISDETKNLLLKLKENK